MNRNVIAGFESLSKQQLFDMAAAHILKTRVCSIKDGCCVYSGTGCAAAPFLTPEARETLVYEWGQLAARAMVPRHEAVFIRDLQRCHDQSSPGPGFIDEWKQKMRSLAYNNFLSTRLLDEDDKQQAG